MTRKAKIHKAKIETADEAAARIARDVLRFETLETRKSDSLDFHDVAVWQVKCALLEAFEAGRAAAKAQAEADFMRDADAALLRKAF